jgi:hypothetical protein
LETTISPRRGNHTPPTPYMGFKAVKTAESLSSQG